MQRTSFLGTASSLVAVCLLSAGTMSCGKKAPDSLSTKQVDTANATQAKSSTTAPAVTKPADSTSANATANATPVTASATGSTAEFTKIVDEYEKVVNHLLELQAKDKPGDASNLNEYMEVLQKSQDLTTKLQSINPADMKPEDANRMVALAAKLTAAQKK